MKAQKCQWISVRAAAERLEIPPRKMMDYARKGLVETLRLPLSRPKVNASDVERLRAESLRPARRGAAG